MKELTIKIMFNESDDKIATAMKFKGFDVNKVTDIFTIIGLLDNLKQQHLERMRELTRLEK